MRSGWLFLGVLSVCLTGGCTTWPPAGSGGAAESLASTSPVAQELQKPVTHADSTGFQLELVKRHLDVLVLEGAELCFPATVVQAKNRESRIAREVAGGLLFDAANDLVIQRKVLNALERQLDHAHTQGACRPQVGTGERRPGELAGRIHELLNADNQFAVDSYELNPKYIARIAEAAGLLREHAGYRLRLTGHADMRDGESGSRDLSLERAAQVKRYLQIMGVAAERIEVAAVGADNPLFAGTAAATQLINRRVSAEVIAPGIREDGR